LDLIDQFFVLSHHIIHLIIVLQLLSLHPLIVLLDLTVVDGALEIVLLAVLHQVDRVVDHLLFLPELRRVDDHQVLIEVQFAHIFGEAAVHGEGQ
jgi:hypothetical protein